MLFSQDLMADPFFGSSSQQGYTCFQVATTVQVSLLGTDPAIIGNLFIFQWPFPSLRSLIKILASQFQTNKVHYIIIFDILRHGPKEFPICSNTF